METPAQEPQILQPSPAAAEIDIAETKGPAPSPKTTSKAGGVVIWLRDLLVSAAISVLIITFLYQPVRVEGTSMLPRLEDRDRLFINKFVYHIESIQRGDVVVFHYPLDPEKSYIKRVIALPGRSAVDRPWTGLAQRQAIARELCAGESTAIAARWRRWWCRTTAIS